MASHPYIRRILLIKPSSLGDIVHALPTLAALRSRFPWGWTPKSEAPSSQDSNAGEGITARDIMTTPLRTVQAQSTIADAARMLRDDNIGSLPVIDGEALVGMVTDRDIVVRAIAENMDPDATCVGAILSTDRHPRHGGADDITAGIASLIEDTPVDIAVQFMDERGIRRVAVHDRDFRLIGVVSRSDLPVSAEAAQRP